MAIEATREYKAAIAALQSISEQIGKTDEVKAIARLFILVASLPVPEALFPYVGELDDPRDIAVVGAYTQAWEGFIRGELDDE